MGCITSFFIVIFCMHIISTAFFCSSIYMHLSGKGGLDLAHNSLWMKNYLGIIFCMVSLVYSDSCCNKSSVLTIIFAGSYVYFQFVQQWPPTTCRLSSKPSNQHRPLQRFTIHGLWPSNYSNPRKPSNCNGSRFNFTKVVCIVFFFF